MKKVIISMFALVLAIGLIACGSAEDKFAKEATPVYEKQFETMQGIIAQFDSSKTQADVDKANEALLAFFASSSSNVQALEAKYKDINRDNVMKNAAFSNIITKVMDQKNALEAAQKKAADVVAKAKKDEKKK